MELDDYIIHSAVRLFNEMEEGSPEGNAMSALLGSMEEHPEQVKELKDRFPLTMFLEEAREPICYHLLSASCDHYYNENWAKVMNCAEGMMYCADTLRHKLLALQKMRNVFAECKLISTSGSKYRTNDFIGRLKSGINDLKELKENCSGSVGGLLFNLLVIALLLAALGMLWFFPPVRAWLVAHVYKIFLFIAAVICIISFFATGSLLAAGAVLLGFALLATGYSKLIPENLRSAIGVYGTMIIVSAALIFLLFLLIKGPLKLNWRFAAHREEVERDKERFRELHGQLLRHVSVMYDELDNLYKTVNRNSLELRELLKEWSDDEADEKKRLESIKTSVLAASAYYSEARSQLKELDDKHNKHNKQNKHKDNSDIYYYGVM